MKSHAQVVIIGGGSLGVSHIFNDGYTGLAYTSHQVDYGNPLEDGAKIDLNSRKYDYVLEKNEISPSIRLFHC